MCFILCRSLLLAQSPSLQWARNFSGTSTSTTANGIAIANDDSGNVYTTGWFQQTVDFDPGPNTYPLSADPTQSNMFVSKLDASGHFIWAKRIGGPAQCVGLSIAVDMNGNVYTTGFFNGQVDFDPGTAVQNSTSSGGENIFILKLSPSGNLKWVKTIGNTNLNKGKSIQVDALGNSYTAGMFMLTTDFDPGPGVHNLVNLGNQDAFVLKLDSLGNFIWARNFGGNTTYTDAMAMALDPSGHLYTTGSFQSMVDFDPGPATFNLTAAGDHDVFVAKWDTSGNLVWASRLGGTGIEYGRGIDVDTFGNVLTSGFFYDMADFDPGINTYNLTPNGADDIFISKLNSNGNFIWAKSIGGPSWDECYSLALDDTGNVYTTGFYNGTVDFDPGPGIFNQSTLNVYSHLFITKLNTAGDFVWAKNMGSNSATTTAYSVCVDQHNEIYATGFFGGTADCDPDIPVQNLVSGGMYDILVLKLGSSASVGLAEDNYELPFSLFPNPGSGTFTINGSNAISGLKLYNSFGQLINSQNTFNGNTARADISNYPSGVYFIEWQDGQQTGRCKWVLTK